MYHGHATSYTALNTLYWQCVSNVKLRGTFKDENSYTLLIGHKSCNMSLFQKESQYFVTNNEVFDKKYKHNNNKTKNQIKKSLAEAGIEPGTSGTQGGCVTTAPPNKLGELIVVKQFNCFDAMGRHVNKQSQICNICFSCNILTCMNNYIYQFHIFTGVGFA